MKKNKQQADVEVRSLYEYRKRFFPKSQENEAKAKELLAEGVVLSNDAVAKLREDLAAV